MRRAVFTLAAVVLLVEAVVVGLVGLVLGLAARKQNMTMGGISGSRIALASWVGQGSMAVFLLVCAVVVAVTAGRAPVRLFVRILLVLCAVLNGVLAALLLALSGWPAFCLLSVTTAVLVLAVLLAYERPEERLEEAGEPTAVVAAAPPAAEQAPDA
jgi:hypothetical protein